MAIGTSLRGFDRSRDAPIRSEPQFGDPSRDRQRLSNYSARGAPNTETGCPDPGFRHPKMAKSACRLLRDDQFDSLVRERTARIVVANEAAKSRPGFRIRK